MARTIYRDIIGTLPTEISVQILEYLEPKHSVQLRYVSKRWSELLSSDVVCTALVKRWYPIDLKLHMNKKPWRWILENASSRDQSLFNIDGDTEECLFVQPEYDETRYPGELYDPVLDPYRSFLEGRAAYIDFSDDRGGRFVCVIDLVKEPAVLVGEFATPSRITFIGVYLMRDYVMATTRDTTMAYVWNIATQECKTIRLPNTNVDRFVADGNIFVATIHGEDGAILYNAIDNSTISVGKGMYSALNNTVFTKEQMSSDGVDTKVNILDAEKELLTMIRRDHRQRCLVHTYSTRNGELIKTKTFELPHSIDQSLSTNLRCGEHDFIVFMSEVRPPKDDPRFEKEDFFCIPQKRHVCTHTLIFNRQTGCFRHQLLWFKDLTTVASGLPRYLHMYEGVIHACRSWEVHIGVNVPMSTESFVPVSTLRIKLMIPEYTAVHTVSPGKILFKRYESRDVNSPMATDVQVYRGVREIEERSEEDSSEDREETV